MLILLITVGERMQIIIDFVAIENALNHFELTCVPEFFIQLFTFDFFFVFLSDETFHLSRLFINKFRHNVDTKIWIEKLEVIIF